MTEVSNNITRRTGAEGSRHDPYGFVEYAVHGRHGKVELHLGLASWCKHEPTGKRADGDEAAAAFFEMMVGVTVPVIVKAQQRLEHLEPYRKHQRACGSKNFECVAGYPGEQYTQCADCGALVGYSFKRGAVE